MEARRNLMVNGNLDNITKNFAVPDSPLLNKIRDATIKLPTQLSDLSESYVKEHLYSFKTASALGITFGGVSADFKQDSEDKVFVAEVLKYADIPEGNLTVRYGVGLRVFYQLQILNIEAKVSSLPLIMASAQFNYLKANVEVKAIGVPTFVVPTGLTLSLESYVNIKKAMDDFTTLLRDQNSPIKPQVLSISYNDPNNKTFVDKYQDIAAQCFALKMIKKGYSYSYALEKCVKAPQAFKDAVQAVFNDIQGLDTNVAAVYANNALKNLSVTYHDKW